MKKNIIFVIIIIILLGIIGFGGYQYMELQKDNDKLTKDNKTITEELNRQKEEIEKAKTEQEKTSTTNDYSLFAKKVIEERKGLESQITINEFTYNYFLKDQIKDGYHVKLDKNGGLTASSKHIADNVLFFKVAYNANGGYRMLYYVTEDGKAYTSNIELALATGEKLKSYEIKNIKQIVNILPYGTDDGYGVLFVDINGNIQRGSID